MPDESSPREQNAIGDYYSALQLRNDRWSTLKDTTAHLARIGTGGRGEVKYFKRASELFESLAPIEVYWAFPGAQAVDYLRRLLENRNFDELSYSVRRVVRALSTGAYRRRRIPLAREDHESDEIEDEATLPIETRALARPYFECLIVDDMADFQERWLRQSLLHMRRSEDSYIYEPVIVPSIEDALIAILFNHNIQAIVIRSGLTLKSKNSMAILKRYLSQIAEYEDVERFQPEDYGPELSRMICKVRPELDVYLVTDRSAEDIAGRELGGCRRVFYNQEDFLELHLNILRGVGERVKTPFFTALKEYSKQPTGVFHALPISRGKSIARSHWIQDMGAFYGPNIFLAET